MNVQFSNNYKRKVTMTVMNRGRWRRSNAPIFNTVCLGRNAAGQQASSESLATTSEASIAQLLAQNHIRVLGSANRSSSGSHSAGHTLQTPKSTAIEQNLQGFKPTSKDPAIIDPLLKEAFRTPEVPLNSLTDKVASSLGKSIRSLPLPGFVKKRRFVSTGSSPWPKSSTSSRTPRTPRTLYLNTVDSNPQMVIAVTEGRGVATGEVGLAAMDAHRPHLVLCQVSDTQTYVNSLAKVNVMQPVEILVPNTIATSQPENRLFALLKSNFPQASITTVQRVHFNDAIGLQKINSFCLPEYASNLIFLQQKFYALSAAAALLKFLEFQNNILFTPESLKIEYQSPENIMYIDLPTAQRLELVMPRAGGERPASLFDVLNHCTTLSGRRLLRANILQPPLSMETIDSRLLTVSELAQNPALLHMIKTALEKFKDVEKLLWLSVQMKPMNNDQMASDRQIMYILILKSSLDNFGSLKDSLKKTQTPFLHKVLKDLDDERFQLLLTTILEVINENAHSANGFMASQIQRCYAVKTNINGMLDITRSSYSNLIAKMHEKVQEMAEEFNLPLKTSHTANKGLHIQINVTKNCRFSAKDLPPVLIQVNRTKNVITCTTEDLAVMNQRMKSLLLSALAMSNVLILELLHRLRANIGCLYKLCEDIAELDMLCSLAQVSSTDQFVYPVFGEKMDVKNSKHPILDFISRTPVTPNDVWANGWKNFHIITGPNMGGKSIYLRQVALLQIMAQIGCFVPAEKADLRITDKIFTRMGFDESIELKASSFQLEVREMRYIMKNMTDKSIVLVDELCHSTASEEGTALAIVICKQLLEHKAYTFLATHFLGLTKLQSWHSNVANHHMEASSNAEGRLIYTYRLSLGVTKLTKYGLTLANLAGFPQNLLERANAICAEIEKEMLPFQKHDDVMTEEELIDEFYQDLAELIEADKWSVEEVTKVQQKWRPILGPFLLNDPTPDNQEDVAVEVGYQNESTKLVIVNTSNAVGSVGQAEMDVGLLNSELPLCVENKKSARTPSALNCNVSGSASRPKISPHNRTNTNGEFVTPRQVPLINMSQQTHCNIPGAERTLPVTQTHDSSSTAINQFKVTEILSPKNRKIRVPGYEVLPPVVRSPIHSSFSPKPQNAVLKDNFTLQPIIDRRTLRVPEFYFREHRKDNMMHFHHNGSESPLSTASQSNAQEKGEKLLNENCSEVQEHSFISADSPKEVSSNQPKTVYNSTKLTDNITQNISHDGFATKFRTTGHNQSQTFTQGSSTKTIRHLSARLGHNVHTSSSLTSSTPTHHQVRDGKNDHLGFEFVGDAQTPLRHDLPLPLASDFEPIKEYPLDASQGMRYNNNDIFLRQNSPAGLGHLVFESNKSNHLTPKVTQEPFDFPQDISPIPRNSPEFRVPAYTQRLFNDKSISSLYESRPAAADLRAIEEGVPLCSTSIRSTERRNPECAPISSPAQMRKSFQLSCPSTPTANRINSSMSQRSCTPMFVNLTPNLTKLPRYFVEDIETEEEDMNS